MENQLTGQQREAQNWSTGAHKVILDEIVNDDLILLLGCTLETAVAEVQGCRGHRQLPQRWGSPGRWVQHTSGAQSSAGRPRCFGCQHHSGISMAQEQPAQSPLTNYECRRSVRQISDNAKERFWTLGLHVSRSSKISDQSHLLVGLNSCQHGPYQQLRTAGPAHKC